MDRTKDRAATEGEGVLAEVARATGEDRAASEGRAMAADRGAGEDRATAADRGAEAGGAAGEDRAGGEDRATAAGRAAEAGEAAGAGEIAREDRAAEAGGAAGEGRAAGRSGAGMDLRALDRRAVEGTIRLVEGISAEQLRLATPCADWTLYGLVRHMTSQHLGFAAAARGEKPDLAVWDSGDLGEDPASAYREAAEQALAAFENPAATERPVELTELRRTVPGGVALAFHFIDYLIHGWDVLATLGEPRDLDPELVDAALALFANAGAAPTTSPLRIPFAQPLPVADDAPALDRLLARVGRRADWS